MNRYMNYSIQNSYDQSKSQYNIKNSGIDDILYQKVVSKLKCSPQQEQKYIVQSIINDSDNNNQDMFETYDTNFLYNPSNKWMFWFIIILVILLIFLLYKYQTSTLSAETIRATILGYSP